MANQIHRSDREWMEIISTCRSSGMTDADWCAENDISIHTFYGAVKRLRKRACEIPDATGSRQSGHSNDVVRVSLVENGPHEKTDVTATESPRYTIGLTIGKATLHLSNDADLCLAEDVIRMAGRLLC